MGRVGRVETVSANLVSGHDPQVAFSGSGKKKVAQPTMGRVCCVLDLEWWGRRNLDGDRRSWPWSP